MDVLLSQAPGFVVGIITGLITGLWVTTIVDRRRKRAQVRQVTASVLPIWTDEPHSSGGRSKIMTGGKLTIKNNSEWPVRRVIVMDPPSVALFHIAHLGPGGEQVESISKERMLTDNKIEAPVTMQLEDDRGRTWRWTPHENRLSPIPEPIPMHSHVVQWLDKRFPRLIGKLLWRLPKRTRDWLWGYAPEG